MPAISVYVTNEDWNFLCQLAAENHSLPMAFTEQLVANELAELRDEIKYLEEFQQELDSVAEIMEKSVEEALS
tara:strand:- start:329 stop:547 length:219 start_codon:yes stop_codon:yes gene_type:complete